MVTLLQWYFNFVGSNRNMYKLTLDGVDVMGERLAQEVSDFIVHIAYLLSMYVFVSQIHDKI